MHLFNLNLINMIRVNFLLCFIVFLTLISVCHSESVVSVDFHSMIIVIVIILIIIVSYLYCKEIYSILVQIEIKYIILTFGLFGLSCVSHSQMQMVHQQNYPIERHIVQTKDGYMLTMYRLPNMNEQRDNRKVILLMHGK